ncbi:fructosamine kinase family protein [Alisedimentitalea sp. MJ-SS2]|uniref:fructosamine kinase family protein n=1 Tax=Aliisedimentitalea sp. MJ-SS2 TaxID=3049795 RepID=UPI002912F533|nr:fructosamine kinase family protein [Alisedimentitalea sp. MJ-SS2]MDU8926509.1 fructosamine kinase family protein [Alisedimentitalea sp. MJ-SS2]
MHKLAQEAKTLLGQPVTRITPLHGGDLSEVLRLHLADNTTVVVKSGPAPSSEAAMLRAIRASGTPAPQVLAHSDSALILEDLPESGGLNAPAWGDLGAHLAILHATTGPRYGWHRDYAFGPVPILNTQHDTWPKFWSENRLLANLPQLPSAFRPDLERIARVLPHHLPSNPPASLLHGDLWSGNVMVDGPRISALIDPACYFGHGEVDLAMLSLFGRPSQAFFEHYGTPTGDWVTRRAIYQLWPAIVHVRLFGAGYHGLLQRLIEQIPT